MDTKKTLRYLVPKVLLGILFLFIVLYAHSRTAFLSQGVSLSVEEIENGQTLTDPILRLKGTAKRAVELTINNREVLIDEKGNFEDVIILSPGLNTLTIETKDKFNNYKQLNYTLWHETETTSETIIQQFRNTNTEESTPENENPEMISDDTQESTESQEETITN